VDLPAKCVIFSGHGLKHRMRGLGLLATRMFHLHARVFGAESAVVLVPEDLEDQAGLVPEGMVRIVRGRPTSRRLVLRDVYWQHRIAGQARAHPGMRLFMSMPHFLALRPPRNTVAFCPDLIHREQPASIGSRPRLLHLRLTEWFARRSRLVLTPSQATATQLERFGIASGDRLRVWPHWIEDAFVQGATRVPPSAVRARLGLPRRYWLYLGGYDLHKNVEFLLEARARAGVERPLPSLVLAGGIPPEGVTHGSRLHAVLRSTGLKAPDLLMPGRVAAEDLPGLLAGAALLIYPSRSEGFGYPPAEAMAVGTPVLAADASSLREVVPDRRCRFSLESQDELVAKLLEAAEDERRFAHPMPEAFTEAAAGRWYRSFALSIAGEVANRGAGV
jgi:glycosyltransferase involved in cell wall biosynthesis